MYKSDDMYDLEMQLLEKIVKEKKFSFKKLLMLLELNAVARG